MDSSLRFVILLVFIITTELFDGAAGQDSPSEASLNAFCMNGDLSQEAGIKSAIRVFHQQSQSYEKRAVLLRDDGTTFWELDLEAMQVIDLRTKSLTDAYPGLDTEDYLLAFQFPLQVADRITAHTTIFQIIHFGVAQVFFQTFQHDQADEVKNSFAGNIILTEDLHSSYPIDAHHVIAYPEVGQIIYVLGGSQNGTTGPEGEPRCVEANFASFPKWPVHVINRCHVPPPKPSKDIEADYDQDEFPKSSACLVLCPWLDERLASLLRNTSALGPIFLNPLYNATIYLDRHLDGEMHIATHRVLLPQSLRDLEDERTDPVGKLPIRDLFRTACERECSKDCPSGDALALEKFRKKFPFGHDELSEFCNTLAARSECILRKCPGYTFEMLPSICDSTSRDGQTYRKFTGCFNGTEAEPGSGSTVASFMRLRADCIRRRDFCGLDTSVDRHCCSDVKYVNCITRMVLQSCSLAGGRLSEILPLLKRSLNSPLLYNPRQERCRAYSVDLAGSDGVKQCDEAGLCLANPAFAATTGQVAKGYAILLLILILSGAFLLGCSRYALIKLLV